MESGVFGVGTKVYYPVHGVAEVTSQESRNIGGNMFPTYMLKVVETGLTIMVPITNAAAVGLREILSDDDIDEVYEILQSKDGGSDKQTWNRRQREYMDKIKTGSPFEIAEVMRDLCLLRDKKALSFGERRILDTARGLLAKEIACSLTKKESEVTRQLDSFFVAAAA